MQKLWEVRELHNLLDNVSWGFDGQDGEIEL